MSEVVQTEPIPLELSPVLSRRFALRLHHFLIATGFGLFFLYHNYIPLFHTDVWGHVAYGEWILETGQIPQEDPFVRLAEGVHAVDTAWLGQALLATITRMGGDEWLSHAFAITILATYLMLAATFYARTGRIGIAAGGALIVWIIASTRHAVIRPEIFGSLCFAMLLWIVVREDVRRRPGATQAVFGRPYASWWIVPLIFAAWANLHGSFVVGFAVLGCRFGGRVIEVLVRSRSISAVIEDAEVRRRLLLGELAVAASLLNPFGMDLLIHTFLFPSNPNLNDIVEWYRLEMVSFEGITVGLSWVLMLVVLRHSRARVSATDVLLLGVFVLAVCLRIRMVSWYAPVAVLVLMPHLADVGLRLWGRWGGVAAARALCRTRPALGRTLFLRSFRYTVLTAFVLWVCFALSPFSRVVLGGKPRPPQHLYSSHTPRELTEYLRQNPPVGQIANPQWWGDWLARSGPAELEVFMTTNAVHVAPRQVWKDYLAIARGSAGLGGRLDRYRINTVVVHKETQIDLARLMRGRLGWDIVYEDDIGFVAQRSSVAAPRHGETATAR